MKSPNLPAESLEEIVFRSRNKSYGAYELRKKYQKYTLVSLLCALFIIGGAIAYPVVAAYLSRHDAHTGSIVVTGEVMSRPPETPAPLPPPPPPPAEIRRDVVFRPPVVARIDSVEGNLLTGEELNNRPNAAPPVDDPSLFNDNSDEKPPAVIEVPELPKPLTWVPQMPSFPGGEGALYKFLSENIVYTQDAREVGLQGTVHLTFVVETDGSITDVKMLRGVGGGLDEEAIRVVKMMPRWSPGMNNGIPVRVQFNLPVKFVVK